MSTPDPILLTISPLRSVEHLAEAYALYLDHPGDYLPAPDVEVLHEAMGDNRLFACFHEDGRIVGVGGTFLVAHAWEPGGAPISVYEVAGLVVHPEVRALRPHGVQDLLVVVRTAALAVQQGDATCVVSSVARDNTSSCKSMIRCGLVQVPEGRVPQWMREVRRTWMAGHRPEVVDHILPPQAMAGHGTLVRTVLAAPVSRGPGEPAYQFRFGDEPILEDVLTSFSTVPDWCETVPAQRLLGGDPSFVPWPR